MLRARMNTRVGSTRPVQRRHVGIERAHRCGQHAMHRASLALGRETMKCRAVVRDREKDSAHGRPPRGDRLAAAAARAARAAGAARPVFVREVERAVAI